MGALDFSGRQQLYYQLYNILFQDIISGRYQWALLYRQRVN